MVLGGFHCQDKDPQDICSAADQSAVTGYHRCQERRQPVQSPQGRAGDTRPVVLEVPLDVELLVEVGLAEAFGGEVAATAVPGREDPSIL